jgi:hypothetical protein
MDQHWRHARRIAPPRHQHPPPASRPRCRIIEACRNAAGRRRARTKSRSPARAVRPEPRDGAISADPGRLAVLAQHSLQETLPERQKSTGVGMVSQRTRFLEFAGFSRSGPKIEPTICKTSIAGPIPAVASVSCSGHRGHLSRHCGQVSLPGATGSRGWGPREFSEQLTVPADDADVQVPELLFGEPRRKALQDQHFVSRGVRPWSGFCG